MEEIYMHSQKGMHSALIKMLVLQCSKGDKFLL